MSLLSAIDLSSADTRGCHKAVFSQRTEKEEMFRQIVLEANAKKLVLIVLRLLLNSSVPWFASHQASAGAVFGYGSPGEESC